MEASPSTKKIAPALARSLEHCDSNASSSSAASSVARIRIPQPALPPQGRRLSAGEIDAMLFSSEAEVMWKPTEQEELVTFAHYVVVHTAAADTDLAIVLFRYIDKLGRGAVSRKDIEHALESNGELRTFIAASDDAVSRMLLNRKARKLAFRDLDKVHKKAPIDVDTWRLYLHELRVKRARFLKMRALARGKPRVYWGLGTYADAHGHVARADCCRLVRRGCLPPGWLDDLAYYIANHHPLLSICLCDEDHPMGRTGKLVTELQVLSLCLLGGAFIFVFDDLFAETQTAEEGIDTASELDTWASIEGNSEDGARDIGAETKLAIPGGYYTLSFFFVTLPSFFVTKIMRYMQTCPCFMYRHDSCCKRCLRCCAKTAGHSIASVTLLISVIASVFGVLLGMTYRGPFFALFVAFGRINGYFIWFFLLLLREFNLCFGPCCLSVGQWRKERLAAATQVGGFYGDGQRVARGVLDDIEGGG